MKGFSSALPSSCFFGMTSLQLVEDGFFKDSFITIPANSNSNSQVFLGCSNLRILPNVNNKVTKYSAFSSCDLRHIPLDYFSTALTVVFDMYSFFGFNRNLDNAIIPDNATRIDYAYRDCNSIRYVLIESLTPKTDSNTFSNCNSTFKLYVPDESVDPYKTASGWSSFAARIYPMSQFATDFPDEQ